MCVSKMSRHPPIYRIGRAFSERSPLNPAANVAPTDTSESRLARSYGSLSPYFGFLRNSVFRSSSTQVITNYFKAYNFINQQIFVYDYLPSFCRRCDISVITVKMFIVIFLISRSFLFV